MNKWPSTIEEAAKFRDELARKIRISPVGKEIRIVAGVDIAYSGKTAVAAAVLYDLTDLGPLEETTSVAEVRFPYVPGYLFFREGPAVLAALEKLTRRPDLLMVDGHGIAHPKKAGYACLLGALLDIPSIGCAKSRLVGDYEEPGREKGAFSALVHRGETVGAVVRTRRGIRPVFVSAGHLIDLDEAVAIVLRCAPKYRIPEPLRAADALAGKTAKELS
jgi:deoxyribonuclease V